MSLVSRADLQAQLEETDRKLGRESLFYFAKFCLGYSLLQEFPHKEVCSFAQKTVEAQRHALDLEPRGAFKTTIFSQALPTWLVDRNPNIRILLTSQVLQNAIDNLGVVKRHLEDSHFKFLYGDHVNRDHWTLEEITSKKRTDHKLKEPTIRCASPERMQTGPHYDVIIADDLCGKENSETPEQRQKIKDHFKLYFSLLDPGGVIFVIGTRWHYEDLYGMIVESGEYPDFNPRIKDAETGGRDGGLYFPERLTPEFLADRKSKLGRDFYNSQYKNDPAPEDEHAKFQKTWFKRYDHLPKDASGKQVPLYPFITIDPGGEEKGSDDWVFFLAFQGEKELFFHDLMAMHCRMAQAWDFLFLWVDQHHPISVGLETTGGQKWLLESLYDQMKSRQRFFNIVPLPHAHESKQTRIERLSPMYQAGAILHSSKMKDLEDQLRRFPKGKDDIADAASMILEIAVAPKSSKPKEAPPKSFDEAFWRAVIAQRKGRKVFVHPRLGSEC